MLKYSEKQTERNNDITGLFIEKIKARKQLTPNRINPNNTINNQSDSPKRKQNFCDIEEDVSK